MKYSLIELFVIGSVCLVAILIVVIAKYKAALPELKTRNNEIAIDSVVFHIRDLTEEK